MNVERPNKESSQRHLNLLETGKKTLRLIQEYPSFRRYVEPVILNIANDNAGVSEIIKEHFELKYHFGPQYTEMGYCVKAFADIVRPESDNTDIGICASEFYLALDILDSTIDQRSITPIERTNTLESARKIYKGERIWTVNVDLQTMEAISQDMRKRVGDFSKTPDGVDTFTGRCLDLVDALYKETQLPRHRLVMVAQKVS